MDLTYEGICKKLGFNPLKGEHQQQRSKEDDWLIDDSKKSPYSVLTLEELDFLCDYYENNKLKSATNRPE